MENKKVIIGIVLTLGIILLIKRYKNKTPKTTTPTASTGVQQTPNTPTKGDGSLSLQNGQLVTGGVKPPRGTDPIAEDPIVVSPAPLPIDFGDGDENNPPPIRQNPIKIGDEDEGQFVDEYFPPPLNPQPTPEPIIFSPLPIDFGNGNGMGYNPPFLNNPIGLSPIPIDFGGGNSSGVLTNINYTNNNIVQTPIYTSPNYTSGGIGAGGDDFTNYGNVGGGRDFNYSNNQSFFNQLEA